jgi:lysophospholipase L1-like esterase
MIFVDTPMPQPVISNPTIQALKKNFRDILTARHFPYIDGDLGFPVDDPSLFSDGNHLSSKGREEFTSVISAELKSWMASQPAAGHN